MKKALHSARVLKNLVFQILFEVLLKKIGLKKNVGNRNRCQELNPGAVAERARIDMSLTIVL
jgi:hypothetical protein